MCRIPESVFWDAHSEVPQMMAWTTQIYMNKLPWQCVRVSKAKNSNQGISRAPTHTAFLSGNCSILCLSVWSLAFLGCGCVTQSLPSGLCGGLLMSLSLAHLPVFIRTPLGSNSLTPYRCDLIPTHCICSDSVSKQGCVLQDRSGHRPTI